MKLKVIPLVVLLLLYASIVGPFSCYMRNRPLIEKLGALPNSNVIKYISADQQQFLGASLIIKALMYYGGRITVNAKEVSPSIDYPAISRTLHTALTLDPYNMDGYYFAQAILVWDVGQYALVNDLLAYGMRYRTWDWYLPFFSGFNYAFFLKDYPDAAKMYMRAGQLSGEPLFIKLAGRYLQRSGQTKMAIAYLSTMEHETRNQAIKKSFQIRLQAFKNAQIIEQACDNYKEKQGHMPSNLHELVAQGYLRNIPVDPYGGHFYIRPDGRIDTTSKFAFAGVKNNEK